MKSILLSILFILTIACPKESVISSINSDKIEPGAHSTSLYIPQLIGKNVGVVVNHTSVIGDVHLVDSLISSGILITKIFTPEHGYKGTADAGEHIVNQSLAQSDNALVNAPYIISLYGKKKKPTSEDLSGIDIMVFDIQDVGVRFYTYISTLHYVMEAAAENDIPIIILDRPNPNGFYVDGPVLDTSFSSFVGMHPVPVVYGLTIGEYATMINEEGWLKKSIKVDLQVVRCSNYNHSMSFDPPIKPSPNLPNLRSILLYPSLCFFEGTQLSVGRGTELQFQVLGHPVLKGHHEYTFTPISRDGAKYPKHQDEKCYGMNLSQVNTEEFIARNSINLDYILSLYRIFTDLGEPYFIENNFFDKLAGSELLKKQIVDGMNEEEIRSSWKNGLHRYADMRKKYLLYEDFK